MTRSQNSPGALVWPHTNGPDFPFHREGRFLLGTLARATHAISQQVSLTLGLGVSPRRAWTLYTHHFSQPHSVPTHTEYFVKDRTPSAPSPCLSFPSPASGALQRVPGDQRSAPRWLSVSSHAEKELHNFKKSYFCPTMPKQPSKLWQSSAGRRF